MSRKPDDDTLLELTQAYIDEAAAFIDDEITTSREKALRYYEGENPDGLPLVAGRSRIVDPVVRDTVEWIMPSLMRIFTAGDKFISVEPHGPEDAEKARGTEAWVNYVVSRMNPGYLLDYQWIRDALLEKVGWQKVWWEETETTETVRFEGVTGQELALIQAQPEVEVLEAVEQPGGDGMPLYSVQVEVERRSADLRIATIPPEEVLYTEDATLDRSSWWFLAHKSEKRLAELRGMGYDVPDDIAGPELEGLDNAERLSDSDNAEPDAEQRAAMVDPGARKVWLYECYVRHDADGDGDAEWLQVMRVGDTLLSVEEIDEPPLYCISPVLRSHRLTGYSMADLVMDLQELMTALQRNLNDHLYSTVNPRSELDITGLTEHTVKDYLDNHVGGFVRVRKPGTVNPLMVAPLPPYTFELINHWQSKLEARTGVTRFNQGLSPDQLNKTATGTSLIMQAANARIELIARNLAETGFKERVRLIIGLSAAHPEHLGQRTLQLSGQALQLTAQDLVGSYDLIVNTGIGTGNRGEQLAHLQTLIQGYQALGQAGMGPGSQNPLFSTVNVFNAFSEYLKLAGYRNTGDFLVDPQNPNAMRDPPAQPKPSVEEILAQVETQKAQVAAMKTQQDAQSDGQKLQLDAQVAQQEAQIEMARLQLEQQKLALQERELALKEYELRAKTNAELLQAQAGMDEKGVASVIDFEQAQWERQLKEREVAIKEREAMVRERESRLGEAKTRAELGEAFDLPELEADRRQAQTMDAVLAALDALRQQITAPKRVVRDSTGTVVGVETLPATGTDN